MVLNPKAGEKPGFEPAIRDAWVRALTNVAALMAQAVKTGLPFNVRHVTHVNANFEWVSASDEQAEVAFEMKEKLGQGAYGAVYRVVYRRGGFVLAAKTIQLLQTDAESAQIINEIKNEIELIKKCRHPNICGYYGVAGPDTQSM